MIWRVGGVVLIALPHFIGAPHPATLESGVPAKAVHGLHALGHRSCAPDKPQGGSQGIWIDREEGVLTGGSDPRKDGCAIGY